MKSTTSWFPLVTPATPSHSLLLFLTLSVSFSSFSLLASLGDKNYFRHKGTVGRTSLSPRSSFLSCSISSPLFLSLSVSLLLPIALLFFSSFLLSSPFSLIAPNFSFLSLSHAMDLSSVARWIPLPLVHFSYNENYPRLSFLTAQSLRDFSSSTLTCSHTHLPILREKIVIDEGGERKEVRELRASNIIPSSLNNV